MNCQTPYGGLAYRLGRCFCSAEVSTGHPHPRNDRATVYCTHLAAFVATKWCVILNAKRERIRLPFKRKNGLPQPLHGFAMTKEMDLGALKRAAENGSPIYKKEIV